MVEATVVKSFTYLSVLGVFILNISDFSLLKCPSGHQMFHFENDR